MNIFFPRTSILKARSMVILYMNRLKNSYDSIVALELVEKWSRTYCEEQKKSFQLCTNVHGYSFELSLGEGISELVKTQILEFNIRRDPIILNAPITQSECSLKPASFINISKFIQYYYLLRTNFFFLLRLKRLIAYTNQLYHHIHG